MVHMEDNVEHHMEKAAGSYHKQAGIAVKPEAVVAIAVHCKPVAQQQVAVFMWAIGDEQCITRLDLHRASVSANHFTTAAQVDRQLCN